MSYFALMFCESCRQMKREDWMKTDSICIGCYEGGQSEEENQQAMGGASEAPGTGNKKKAQPRGQAGRQLHFGF
jgi:hypothetical protein